MNRPTVFLKSLIISLCLLTAQLSAYSQEDPEFKAMEDSIRSKAAAARKLMKEIYELDVARAAMTIKDLSKVQSGNRNNPELRDTIVNFNTQTATEVGVKSTLQYKHFWTDVLFSNTQDYDTPKNTTPNPDRNVRFDIRFYPDWDTVAERYSEEKRYRVVIYTSMSDSIEHLLDKLSYDQLLNAAFQNRNYRNENKNIKDTVNLALFTAIKNLGLRYNLKDEDVLEIESATEYFSIFNPEDALKVKYRIKNNNGLNIRYCRFQICCKQQDNTIDTLFTVNKEINTLEHDEFTWNGKMNAGKYRNNYFAYSAEPLVINLLVSENKEFNPCYQAVAETKARSAFITIKNLDRLFAPSEDTLTMTYQVKQHPEIHLGKVKIEIYDKANNIIAEKKDIEFSREDFQWNGITLANEMVKYADSPLKIKITASDSSSYSSYYTFSIMDSISIYDISALEDKLKVTLTDTVIKKKSINIRAKGKHQLVSGLYIDDTLSIKEAKYKLELHAEGEKKAKLYPTSGWETVKVNEPWKLSFDSLPEGRYKLLCNVRKDTIVLPFYVRGKRYDFACEVCGRDLSVTYEKLRKMAYGKSIKLNSTHAQLLSTLLKKADINTCKAHVHFFSQCAHESHGFNSFSEYANWNMNNFYSKGIFASNCNTNLMYNQGFWSNKEYKKYFTIGPFIESTSDTTEKNTLIPIKNTFTTYYWKANKSDKSDFSSCSLVSISNEDTIRFPRKFVIDTVEKSNIFIYYTLSPEQKIECTKNLYSLLYASYLENGSSNTTDGYDYRGRGMIHLTGRKNYREVSEKCNTFFKTEYNFENDPEKLTTDMNQVIYSAIAYYLYRNCINDLKKKNCLEITKIINFGLNGYLNNPAQDYDRLILFKKYRDELFYGCNITEDK